MISRFESFLENSTISKPLSTLPVFHNTEAYNLRSIIEAGQLNTIRDEKFNDEELLYLFYGKPAYHSSKYKDNQLLSLAPVSLVFSFIDEMKIARIFPFDTGAYYKQILDEYFHHMNIYDFEMTGSIEAVKKHICCFWGTNESYLNGQCREVIISPSFFEVESFYALINGKTISPEFDDRAYAVEIQAKAEISINDSLIAVIMPDEFKKDTEFLAKIPIGVDKLYYHRYLYAKRDAFYQDMRKIAVDYLYQKNLISMEYDV